MQKTLTPKICQGESPQYAGTVTMKLPTYDQRMALYESAGIEDAENLKNISLVRALAKHLPDYLVAVDIKRLDDGYHFNSWDELQYDSDMAGVISECCLALITKVRAGNLPAPG